MSSRSDTSRSTYTRSIEPRAWPAPAQPAHSAPLAARATCASASTSIASLPPSSTVTSFSSETHARATARPTAGEPVNSTLSTGARASAIPTCVPPCTTRTRPSGSVARASTPMIRSPVRHARRAGLNTTPLPASSAPAICASGCANGALPAPITPTTPNGSYATRARLRERHRAVDAHAPRPEHPRAVLRDPDQRVDRRQQLGARDLRARAALLAADQPRQLVELVDDRLRHAAHVAGAVLDAQQRPQRLHLARGGDHPLDLLGWRRRAPAEDRPGGRVARAQGLRWGGLLG